MVYRASRTRPASGLFLVRPAVGFDEVEALSDYASLHFSTDTLIARNPWTGSPSRFERTSGFFLVRCIAGFREAVTFNVEASGDCARLDLVLYPQSNKRKDHDVPLIFRHLARDENSFDSYLSQRP